MKCDAVNINLTLSVEIVQLLQIAIGHLAISIDNGSFDVGTNLNQDAVLDNLHGLHHQMSHILNDFA
jgi:hypothetical protein